MNISVGDVFALRDKGVVLIRLPSFEWDFTLGLRVHLRGGGLNLDTRQVGTGNHQGRATIMLSPEGEWVDAHRVLLAIIEGGVIAIEVASNGSGL